MNIDQKATNELRVLSAEMITNAKSGHPGIALGSAPILYSLFANVLAVDPTQPNNFCRDRFVLSAGHGSSLLYATLFAMGFDLTTDDLKNFRHIGSRTPGHPEVGVTSGVDCSTGPLGQGIANAVGMAIAQKHISAKYNKPDCSANQSKVFCLCGDGCLMEGVAHEALSIAGNLKLDNFVLLYDCNQITIEGKTQITFDDDIKKCFEAIHFAVLIVKNGNDTQAITRAIKKAVAQKKPTVVVIKTTIGYGSDLAGNQKIHGTPLTPEQLENLKKTLQVQKPKFDFSDDVKAHFCKLSQMAKERLMAQDHLAQYKAKYPTEYAKLQDELSNSFQSAIESLQKTSITECSSLRDTNHLAMQKLAEYVPNLFGGSADVATSTKAYVENSKDFNAQNYAGALVHFGVREHAMSAICNGIGLFGGLLPYQSCFLSFVDYLKPALRMSALMKIRTLLVLSHDSLTAGEDGPTHQPIEQLPTLRLIPNTTVYRPYNSSEILAGFVHLLTEQKPLCMVVGKEKIESEASDILLAEKGGYVLQENANANITIVSTGSDVSRAILSAQILAKKGIFARIVSMPCVSVFESQDETYKKSVFQNLPKVFVEASDDNIWYKFCQKNDLVLGLSTFGTSGKGVDVLKYMQFDEESLAQKIEKWYKKNFKKVE